MHGECTENAQMKKKKKKKMKMKMNAGECGENEEFQRALWFDL